MYRLNFQKHSPTLLKQYIAAFYIYHFDANSDVQLFPKGVFEIVFQSDIRFQHNTAYSSGWQTRPQNFIGGLHNKSYHVRSYQENSYCIVVEFKPDTAKYFIPHNLRDFQNNVVDISDVWGSEALTLTEKLNREAYDRNKVRFIEHFLLGKIIEHKQSKIDNALKLIFASQGFIDVSELAKSCNLSDAQFRKRFNNEVGISPSQYCKIIRINTTLAELKNQYQKPLIELSNQLGYFDQSHFIKDFKSVTGSSPKKFKL
jgi:AraC-like DNA-binding protein